MSIWQVAAGDGSRDYADVFLKFGVILVGPGSLGNYFEKKNVYTDSESEWYRDFIPTIAENIRIGDLVVLKRPHSLKWEIVAVGEVISDYEYQEVFSDVDGWDLQHCRRVRWKKPKELTIIKGLRRGTLFNVNNDVAIQAIRKIWAEGELLSAQQIPLPESEISVDELIDSLMEYGLPTNTAQDITSTIWKLRRIAQWYHRHGKDVGEHEIRTFLIAPLLTSLGFAEQKLKIEWKNVDIAIFEKVYKPGSEPVVLIESKRLGDGLLYAPDQAKRYAELFPSCCYFVVSDGICYKLYQKVGDEWQFSSYMNLISPKRHHPYEQGVGGAVDFFLGLIPTIKISHLNPDNPLI